MDKEDLVTAIAVLFLFLFPPFLLLIHIRRRSPSTNLPPSPPSLPILGHLHHLLFAPTLPHHTLTKLSTSLRTPILHLRLGHIPTIVVSTPRLAREVLRIHDSSLASRPRLLSAQYLSFGCSDVTFSPYGPYWRQARRICVSELLSTRKVASFSRIRQEEINLMLRSFRFVVDSKNPEVDVSKGLFELANNVLCRVAFGRRFDGGSRLAEVLGETQRLFSGFDVSEFYPGLWWVNVMSGWTRRLKRNLRDLSSVCDEVIGEHLEKKKQRKNTANAEVMEDRDDFVDVLLRVQKSGDLDVPISDDNLKALVLDMFVAGTDTTSATLEWVMTDLAGHPDVLRKAQEEVRTTVETPDVKEDDLPHLRYTKSIIKETLRLHPPVPLLVPRESITDCQIDGYAIPAKTRVLVNTYAIGRDPETWDSPEEYLPERFAGTADLDNKGDEFNLLPFGGGRRGCPGYSFALATVELALARMLYHFDWDLPAGVRPEDVDVDEVFGLATRKKTPLVLVARKVSDYEFNNFF